MVKDHTRGPTIIRKEENMDWLGWIVLAIGAGLVLLVGFCMLVVAKGGDKKAKRAMDEEKEKWQFQS